MRTKEKERFPKLLAAIFLFGGLFVISILTQIKALPQGDKPLTGLFLYFSLWGGVTFATGLTSLVCLNDSWNYKKLDFVETISLTMIIFGALAFLFSIGIATSPPIFS